MARVVADREELAVQLDPREDRTRLQYPCGLRKPRALKTSARAMADAAPRAAAEREVMGAHALQTRSTAWR